MTCAAIGINAVSSACESSTCTAQSTAQTSFDSTRAFSQFTPSVWFTCTPTFYVTTVDKCTKNHKLVCDFLNYTYFYYLFKINYLSCSLYLLQKKCNVETFVFNWFGWWLLVWLQNNKTNSYIILILFDLLFFHKKILIYIVSWALHFIEIVLEIKFDATPSRLLVFTMGCAVTQNVSSPYTSGWASSLTTSSCTRATSVDRPTSTFNYFKNFCNTTRVTTTTKKGTFNIFLSLRISVWQSLTWNLISRQGVF